VAFCDHIVTRSDVCVACDDRSVAGDGRPATAREMVAFTGAWRDGLAAAPAGVITAQSTKPHIPANAARNRAIFPIEKPP
jgi:hypothetical protein